ncbi:MAG: TerB family tellurite resistance protein [Gammaproteobacteria bacterium]|nr:TerB family tellurite resistance protein [Gammaproteobacteria bacterium]MBQ0840187.1 TerB family tellurite resistance protein [Gammaproteobacteria bacterium]
MISKIKTFFQDNILNPSIEGKTETPLKNIQKASAALLIETMLSDNLIDAKEQQAVKSLLVRSFDLSSDECDELFSLAKSEVADSTSLYEFTGQVNLHFSADDKFELIKQMWHVALIDNVLDKYEESLIRQVADLIYLPHSQFIKAKSLVKNELDLLEKPLINS